MLTRSNGRAAAWFLVAERMLKFTEQAAKDFGQELMGLSKAHANEE